MVQDYSVAREWYEKSQELQAELDLARAQVMLLQTELLHWRTTAQSNAAALEALAAKYERRTQERNRLREVVELAAQLPPCDRDCKVGGMTAILHRRASQEIHALKELPSEN